MLNRVSLTFKKQKIETMYVQQQEFSILQEFQLFTLFSEVLHFFQSQTYLAIRCIYEQAKVRIILSSAYIPFGYFFFVILRKRFNWINRMLLLIQIIFGFKDFLEIWFEEQANNDMQWFFGFSWGLCHFSQNFLINYFEGIYLQGNHFIIQTFGLFLVIIIHLFTISMNPFLYFNILYVFMLMVLFKYVYERKRRFNFLSQNEKQKWHQIIEDILPSWVVIVKYDYKTTFLSMETSNRNFRKEFEISNDFEFRKLLRTLKIFTKESVSKKLKPVIEDSINYEQYLVKILTHKADAIQELQLFYGFLVSQIKSQRVFKIQQIYFEKSLESMVLLHFQEITENKYDELEQEISFRDQTFYEITQLALQTKSSCLGFLKFIKPYIKQSTKYQIYSHYLDQQIFNQYLRYNDFLNYRSLLKINYNIYKFTLDLISLDQIEKMLEDDFKMQQVPIKKKLNLKKFHLIRSTSRANQIIPLNKIRNDRQKFLQVIITICQFIHFMCSDQNVQPKGIPIQFQIKQMKKQPQHYQVSLRHPYLSISNTIQEVLNENWAGSELSIHHYGVKNHFEKLKQIMLKLSETAGFKEQKLSDKFRELHWSGMPIAQFILGQIGPFNLFFFKFKQFQNFPNDQQHANQISFYVYQDLQGVIEEINSNEPNPQFLLQLNIDSKKNLEKELVKAEEEDKEIREECIYFSSSKPSIYKRNLSALF